MPEMPELDPVVHGKLRLAVLSLLIGVEEADFTWLRLKTGSTDGNLGAQMLKLEEAGYVAMEKRFDGRSPNAVSHDSGGTQGAGEVCDGAEDVVGRGVIERLMGPDFIQ